MKRRLFIPLFLIILALAGCGGGFSATTYNLSGIVQDQYSNRIDGATVTLLSTSYSATTNSLGQFTFSNLSGGTYTVQISKDGFNTRQVDVVVQNNIVDFKITIYDSLSASASGKVEFGEYIQVKSAALTDCESLNTKYTELPEVILQSQENSDGILIQFNENVTKSEIIELLSNMGLSDYKIYDYGLVKLNIFTDPATKIAELEAKEEVKYIQLNYINRLNGTPNDPNYVDQWNLKMLNLEKAWDYAKGDEGDVIVAVLDSGIKSQIDLDNNILPGWDIVDNNNDPIDDVTPENQVSHGTFIASIIAAETNNAMGLAGIGWNNKVMPIKVFKAVFGDTESNDSLVAQGIYKAVEMGADIINLSLANTTTNPEYAKPIYHPVMENALKYATDNGIAIFAASGNDGIDTISYPASSSYTFSVGAVSYSEERCNYSNFGSGLDIMAPGGDGNSDDNTNYVPGYKGDSLSIPGLTGTSLATAHVSGVAGLIYTMGVTDPYQVYNILIDSATNKGDVIEYGAGILNAEMALYYALNNNSSVDITDVTLYPATYDASEKTWTLLTNEITPDASGNYTVYGIPPQEYIYIVGFINNNNNEYIETGEYFGATDISYIYDEKENQQNVDFKVYKVTSTQIDGVVPASIDDNNIVYKLKFK